MSSTCEAKYPIKINVKSEIGRMSVSDEDEVLVVEEEDEDSDEDRTDWGIKYVNSQRVEALSDEDKMKAINQNELSKAAGNVVPSKLSLTINKENEKALRQSTKRVEDYDKKRDEACLPCCMPRRRPPMPPSASGSQAGFY